VSPFVVRMAWRETRGAWRHVALFTLCIALGVAALVGVGSFATNLERTLGREARALMGGDVELRSARPLPANDAPPLASAVIEQLEFGDRALGADSSAHLFVVNRSSQPVVLLDAVGNPERVLRIGDSGAGQLCKVCNQMVIGGALAVVSEAFALARKAGVDPVKVRQALLGGFATCGVCRSPRAGDRSCLGPLVHDAHSRSRVGIG